MSSEANAAVVRSYLDAVERFDGEAAGRLLHPDIVQIEHPNRLYASGQVRRGNELLRDLQKGRQVLRSQNYEVHSIVASGDRVVAELRWEGVLAVPLGALGEGDRMVAHIAAAFRLLDGRIIAQTNYDCYEDFTVAA